MNDTNFQVKKSTSTEALVIHVTFEHGWATLVIDAVTGLIAVSSDWLSGLYTWPTGNKDAESFFNKVAGFQADYFAEKLFVAGREEMPNPHKYSTMVNNVLPALLFRLKVDISQKKVAAAQRGAAMQESGRNVRYAVGDSWRPSSEMVLRRPEPGMSLDGMPFDDIKPDPEPLTAKVASDSDNPWDGYAGDMPPPLPVDALPEALATPEAARDRSNEGNLWARMRSLLEAISGHKTPVHREVAAEAKDILELWDSNLAGPELVALADDVYGSDDIEIDGDALESRPGDGTGVWVGAWVWIKNENDESEEAEEDFDGENIETEDEDEDET